VADLSPSTSVFHCQYHTTDVLHSCACHRHHIVLVTHKALNETLKKKKKPLDDGSQSNDMKRLILYNPKRLRIISISALTGHETTAFQVIHVMHSFKGAASRILFTCYITFSDRTEYNKDEWPEIARTLAVSDRCIGQTRIFFYEYKQCRLLRTSYMFSEMSTKHET
jgi:hypothetical protein